MLGIGSYAFRWHVGIGDRRPEDPLDPLAMLDIVDGLGVKLLQVADNLPLHARLGVEIEAFGARAQELGIAIELGMTGCDPVLVSRYLELCVQLGSPLLRIAPTAEESARSDEEIAELFRALVPGCELAGVVLAVENHFHLPSPRLNAILDRVGSDSVGVCLDVANSIACGEWPEETIDLLAARAVNLHLKDYRVALDPHGVGCAIVGTPLGEGLLDIGNVFSALAKHGREVNVILEHWLPWQGDFASSRQAERDWLGRSVAAARARDIS
jgi:sugar phosphate isomerase/epimerase